MSLSYSRRDLRLVRCPRREDQNPISRYQASFSQDSKSFLRFFQALLSSKPSSSRPGLCPGGLHRVLFGKLMSSVQIQKILQGYKEGKVRQVGKCRQVKSQPPSHRWRRLLQTALRGGGGGRLPLRPLGQVDHLWGRGWRPFLPPMCFQGMRTKRKCLQEESNWDRTWKLGQKRSS